MLNLKLLNLQVLRVEESPRQVDYNLTTVPCVSPDQHGVYSVLCQNDMTGDFLKSKFGSVIETVLEKRFNICTILHRTWANTNV